jgi:hypothetical protein
VEHAVVIQHFGFGDTAIVPIARFAPYHERITGILRERPFWFIAYGYRQRTVIAVIVE